MELWTFWISTNWLCWGAGPVISANAGFFVTVVLLDIVCKFLPDSSFITYSSATHRKDNANITLTKISYFEQFKSCILIMLGPTAIVGGILNALICKNIFNVYPAIPMLPTLQLFLAQIILLLLVGDFCLYWGHRIQHMNKFLWENFHSVHHKIDTPIPISTLYIESMDATIQASLPIMLAAVAVRPHPISLYLYIFLRLSDNVVNHSGLKPILWLDILTLKALPFRASVAHHDAHHKFSNYAGNAKNFAEYFWIWDYMFNTLGSSSAIANAANKKE